MVWPKRNGSQRTWERGDRGDIFAHGKQGESFVMHIFGVLKSKGEGAADQGSQADGEKIA